MAVHGPYVIGTATPTIAPQPTQTVALIARTIEPTVMDWDNTPIEVSFGATSAPSSLPAHDVTWSPLLDVTPDYKEPIVPGSVRIAFAGKTITDNNGQLVMDIDPATGAGTPAGAIDYTTGVATISGGAVPGQANLGTITGLVTTLEGHPVDGVWFRTAAAPLRPGSLTIQFARANAPGTVTVTAATDGTISATDVVGSVDYETGVVRLRFGRWVTAAGNESEEWYLAANVVGGQIFRPLMVFADTIRYAATAYAYLPLDATILGLNPVRLPSDGRVPIFGAGDVAVIHHSQTVSGAYSNGQTVNLGRTRLARVRVTDNAGVTVPAGAAYTVNLDTGILTFGSVSGLAQPLTIEHRIEDMALVSEAQISGQLSLTRPITHDYPLGSHVSSALIAGDMQARYTNIFDQATWTNVWSDTLIGSAATAGFNDAVYPIVVTNTGTIQERWALVFTNTTSFNIVGEYVGQIGTGNTATPTAPINPATGMPYFSINPLGFGSGWSAGNVLRFNTVAANYPVWIARTIQQGPATAANDSFTLQIRGDIDA